MWLSVFRGYLLTIWKLGVDFCLRFSCWFLNIIKGTGLQCKKCWMEAPFSTSCRPKKHCLRFAYCLFLFLASDQSGKICNPFCFSQYIIRNSRFIEKYPLKVTRISVFIVIFAASLPRLNHLFVRDMKGWRGGLMLQIIDNGLLFSSLRNRQSAKHHSQCLQRKMP